MCIESPGEEDKVECNDADEFGDRRVIELNACESVAARQHTHHQKEDEGRHPETLGCFTGYNAQKQKQRTNQQDIVDGDVHGRRETKIVKGSETYLRNRSAQSVSFN